MCGTCREQFPDCHPEVGCQPALFYNNQRCPNFGSASSNVQASCADIDAWWAARHGYHWLRFTLPTVVLLLLTIPSSCDGKQEICPIKIDSS